MTDPSAAMAALHILHYVYPASIFVFYSSISVIGLCVTLGQAAKPAPHKALHRVIFCVMLGILVAHVIEAVFLLAVSSDSHVQPPSQDTIISSIISSMAWIVLVAGSADTSTPIQLRFTGTWVLSTVMEGLILGLTVAFDNQSQGIRYARLTLGLVRLCSLFILICLASFFLWPWKQPALNTQESQPLLASPENNSDGVKNGQAQGAAEYGTIDQNCGQASPPDDVEAEIGAENGDDDDDEAQTPIDRLPKGNWWSYIKRFYIFVPMLWPKGQKMHQLRILGCGLCLLAVRALNLLTPRQSGIVIDTLTKASSQGLENASAWIWIEPIALLALFNWLNSASGFPFIRSYLWIPVDYNILQKLHTRTYNHIMELSCDFHDSKRSGKLWYSIWNGYSVSSFLELVLFDIIPVLFDFALAALYIYFFLDPYLALMVLGTSMLYLKSAAMMVSRLNIIRRFGRELHKSEYEVMTETMSNWRTVSYFNRVPYEEGRYASASRNAGKASIRLSIWVSIEQALKETIMELGLLLMLIVAGYRVVHHGRVGDVVVLMQLWSQIVQPLSVIADSFHRIASDLVDAEDLLKVLQKTPSIQDDKDAKPLDLKQGEVEFKSVNFSYDKKRLILKDVSFRVTPGQTVALVGETGGGKSTILKLLFRFYDVDSGCVKIDGQDIRRVTLVSLRDIIGNVPQDATLFNDTILNNVRYAKLDATDEEVFEACKAAAIHDKVMTFTKRYESKVGEGGTKLSGGELQRIAIARVVLQNPKIVLLDEATSSVDTETEAHIQESLKRLTSGRTTFVIAHRLSTIVNADLILVVHKGEIVEQGSHKELIKIRGEYHNLWTRQMFPDASAKENGDREMTGGFDYVNDLPDAEISKLKQSTMDVGKDEPASNGSTIQPLSEEHDCNPMDADNKDPEEAIEGKGVEGRA